ncbi:MAG: DUF4476 domain-containing protein [Ginsengibacter sp.]
MFQSRIRKLFFFFIALVFTLAIKAQKPHFIYLQTDNGQPFYTKFNGKLISSSSEGYAILSGVVDGDYTLTVGFPKNEMPEETFTINMNNNNEGFLLKKFDDKGLQLFNLQTLALIEPSRNNTVAVNTKKDNDAFSIALAGAVKDSSILQNHENIVSAPAKNTDSTTAANADTAKGTNNVSAKVMTLQPPLSALDSSKSSSITKILDVKGKEGSQMIYADKDSNGTDTINVLMPVKNNQADSNVEKNIAAQNNPSTVNNAPLNIAPAAAATASNTGISSEKSTVSSETKTKQDSLVNNNIAATSTTDTSSNNNSQGKPGTAVNNTENAVQTPSENRVIILPKEASASRTNSDCKNFATDNDFLTLRKKMAEENDNEKMIRVAKKYFKSKCYSTAQIKNLSYIFLTNDSKYQFFEAAYPFVSDSNQYLTLENQFTDSYNLNRFKALVGQ